MMSDLLVYPKETEYQPDPQPIYPYRVLGTEADLPLYYARTYPSTEQDLVQLMPLPRDLIRKVISFSRPSYTPLKRSKFVGKLYSEQELVKKEAVQWLDAQQTILIACHPGFGKTCLALYLARKIGLRTAILVHREVIRRQWREALERFLPQNTFQIITTKSTRKDVDFYIIGVRTVEKLPEEWWNEVGLLIVDEAHAFCPQKSLEAILRFHPKYAIALTASPSRSDGLDRVLDLFFGSHRITRKLFRPHDIYRFKTIFPPEEERNYRDRLNWDLVLKSQAMNEERNHLIVRLLQFFHQRVIMVLCKRKLQTLALLDLLQTAGESVTMLIGSQETFDREARILLSTYSKTGVGFDHPRLDMLLIAGDVEELIDQYHGRIFRRRDVRPIVVDLVDPMGTLESHWRTRRRYYESTGGIVHLHFERVFPEFFRENDRSVSAKEGADQNRRSKRIFIAEPE